MRCLRSAIWRWGPARCRAPIDGPLFWRAFFFSIHTFATVGYGNIVPVSFLANALVTMQTLFGLLSLAVATGLVFARFSRPNARVLYSRAALIAPYQDQTSFQFRIVNGRRSQLLNVQALVMHSRFESVGGARVRRFYSLELERNFVAVFPANWTVVHPISPQSPIFGWSQGATAGGRGGVSRAAQRGRRNLLANRLQPLVLRRARDRVGPQICHDVFRGRQPGRARSGAAE